MYEVEARIFKRASVGLSCCGNKSIKKQKPFFSFPYVKEGLLCKGKRKETLAKRLGWRSKEKAKLQEKITQLALGRQHEILTGNYESRKNMKDA